MRLFLRHFLIGLICTLLIGGMVLCIVLVLLTKPRQDKAAPISLSESLDASADDLVRVAKEFGFEGTVAKRKDSVYESGKRTGAWVKYRVNRGQEFVIGGYTPGNPIDAIIVGYYENGKLLYSAKVWNGFVPQVRRQVAARLKGLEIKTCPFANLPERKRTQWALIKEEMKNCVWLRPELVAQIEFTEMDSGWSPETIAGLLNLDPQKADLREATSISS